MLHHSDPAKSTRRTQRRKSQTWKLSATSPLRAGADDRDVSRRSEYENLLDAIYDGVLVTALDGRILESNARAVEFFRRPEPELCKLNIVNVVAGADSSLLTSIHRNLRAHRYTVVEGSCVRADRKTFPAEIAVSRITRQDETRLCFLVRNITERKRAQDALKQAVTRLQEHDRARAQFVSNVSHELKTPLTSMLYAIYNLLNGVVGPLPARVRRYLQMLDGDCRRMLASVSDILDLRRIDTQTLKLDHRCLPFGRLVRWALESLRLQAKQKNITLNIKTGTGNLFLDGDAPKLERVILNIVGNAVKFTPAGGRIDVEIALAPGRGGMGMLAVEDTGMGIPAQLIPRVTERYFTVGEQPTGTGLGLAISKEIVTLHGGELKLESPPPGQSVGTRVTVLLPIATPPLIMLIEDDDLVRETIAGQVSDWGFRVLTLAEGGAAMETIKREKPDLLIVDLQLPGLEGTDVILKLKANLEMMRKPVVVLTGLRLNEKQQKILSNFGIPTLRKPWNEDELREHVETAFLGAVSAIRRPREKTFSVARKT